MICMSYRRSNKRYLANSLPVLEENERIYLNVPYLSNGFARACHCGFDPDRKLWFTGLQNRNLRNLLSMYDVNNATSDDVMRQLFGTRKE